MSSAVLGRHIEMTPGICGGKPRVAGRRITVQNIAIWHERMGMSPDEIASDYDLTLGDVHAALAYYFDHQNEIDQQIRDDEAFAAELRNKTPSVLARKLERLKGGSSPTSRNVPNEGK